FDDDVRHALQASGGDDYELCFTAPIAARALLGSIGERTSTPLTRIGRIVAGEGVSAFGADGRRWVPQRAGYTHFAE
ncbi:MAG: thiamine-phosphate kinase, partial [Lysobacter sp.]